ncbi:MAG: methionyl-tRNA formyltransferase [Bacillota bacterium]|nr:methionyl-tRNA formyltransferase [Bacillota bacterium]MDI7250218.1 methionyl-tRNA formyltransferase [Bacillota bacterium]
MRIILIGQEAFGRASLEALLDQGEQVVGVITVPEVPGGKPNPVRELAEARGIPCLQPRNLKGNRVYEWVRDLAPDLLVLAYVTEFVPGRIIQLARLGGINYHPSLLPKFRGGTAINWAIIYGEKETGVTIHYIDEGVDTGDIILQRRVEIGPDDTSASLYYNKLFPLGVEMIAEAVRLIREGRAPRIRQDEALASFQPVIKESDTRIDWSQPVRRVHDLIRGAAPRPGAWTTRGGEKVKVWESALPAAVSAGAVPGGPGEMPGPAAPGAVPGQILEVSAAGVLVAAGEGVVLLKRLGAEAGPKLPAAEYAAQVGLAPGQRLGD